MNIENINLSPLMKQYFKIKNQHPDKIIFFQVGDFYEIFFDDAKKVAPILAIALTSRGTDLNGEPIALCGIPVHVLNHHMTKLVQAGFKIAICDQIEQARPGKIVERAVTQVLTPGTLTDSNLLKDKSASYLCAIFPTEVNFLVCFVEILTGQMFVTSINLCNKLLDAELAKFLPDEIIVPDLTSSKKLVTCLMSLGYCVSQEQFVFNENAVNWFNLAGHNFQDSGYLASLIYNYLLKNNKSALENIRQISFYMQDDFLMLDAATQRNLELVKNISDGSSNFTLFSVLDCSATSMGSRIIKKWITRPLIKIEQIKQRLDLVEIFKNNIDIKDFLFSNLKAISDIERVVGRISLKRAHVYDYVTLSDGLKRVPEISKCLDMIDDQKVIFNIKSKLIDMSDLANLLDLAINRDRSKDWTINTGFSKELDRLRYLLDQGVEEILKIEKKEQEKTGINSLKIRYNQSGGYAIEVTNPNLHLVPDYYLRLQTLTNRQRYTIQELKDLEYEINKAKNEINLVEKELYERVKLEVLSHISNLKKISLGLAHLDAILGISQAAYLNGFSRPEFNQSKEIIIKDGFHPIVKKIIENNFIPNSVELTQNIPLWIITGPNMGGKSTFLRQVALIQIMAQIGSFVPAVSASLPIVDRIFTRIGASDNLSQGKSTFLVEMEETALICTKATENSLVILDEVGRGTSTFDGLAIAQAVVEYIYLKIKAKCLFATHYHELTHLKDNYSGIDCYYAATLKNENGIILLHKIKKGISDGSFGIEVAKVANLPKEIIDRSYQIIEVLKETENDHAKRIKAI